MRVHSQVVQVSGELYEQSVSIVLGNAVATVTAGMLRDESAIVQKSALYLLLMIQ